MSDIMTPLPMKQLLDWVLTEYQSTNSIFSVKQLYKPSHTRKFMGRNLESPVGPAAGPHSQLAQNIIASYVAGARFFELKTVQTLDGRALAECVKKPCILAEDEGYNVEWSTELTVEQAMEEYIKAWVMLSFLAREYQFGEMDGFQFAMSVGYDLEGIKSEKIDRFIEGLKEAKDTESFKSAVAVLEENLGRFQRFKAEDVKNISSHVSSFVTLSTLHGCPPAEIERIATYLLTEKKINTYIKCNPTLLGYEFARETLNSMGYEYIAFGEFHFDDDLQYVDAVPMLKRLLALGAEKNLEFGVKITNTFPVDIKNGELPGEEMYMSGKALYPLSISLAAELSGEFNGKLPISFSGGADYFNIRGLIDAGITPVTVATTLLKAGGYGRLKQLAEVTADCAMESSHVDAKKVGELAEQAFENVHHVKKLQTQTRKMPKRAIPLFDCDTAPCQDACPIGQDITAYVELTAQGKYEEAMDVITDKNPLPFITGTICPHRCQSNCSRVFYENSVEIRKAKLLSANHAYENFLQQLKDSPDKTAEKSGEKVAIIGGGPAGIAAAYFLARSGASVTVFEKEHELGGVVRHIIPEFRISHDTIDRDISLIRALGVEIRQSCPVTSLAPLKEEGFTAFILAVGAYGKGKIELSGGEAINALDFLRDCKADAPAMSKKVGKNVVVIGGGNTAMDTARVAKGLEGVSGVSLVYRRSISSMPAEAEEVEEAMEDGVEICELLSPVKMEQGVLTCEIMSKGENDASGRPSVVGTGEFRTVLADTVIAAVGEQVEGSFLQSLGLDLDGRGKAQLSDAYESSVEKVYVIGDGRKGPATVVEAIADARLVTDHILNLFSFTHCATLPVSDFMARRGILEEPTAQSGSRCLGCGERCQVCVEVCPNRANLPIMVGDDAQVLHYDAMCNECGNCASFCPYGGKPYLEKFTMFLTQEEWQESENSGFVMLDTHTAKVRLEGVESTMDLSGAGKVEEMISAVVKNYSYL